MCYVVLEEDGRGLRCKHRFQIYNAFFFFFVEETLFSLGDQTSYMSICLGEQDPLNLQIDQLSPEELKKKVLLSCSVFHLFWKEHGYGWSAQNQASGVPSLHFLGVGSLRGRAV